MPCEVRATARFVRDVTRLRRRYPRIGEDLATLLDTLQTTPDAGDRIPGIRGPVYKIRVPSRDMQRGTRGGYRVVYYARLHEGFIYLLTIYAKAQREDIRLDEINGLLAQIQ